MKLQLLVSKWCPTCPAAEKVWSEAAAREGFELEVLDVGDPDGRRVVVDLGIRTVPAMVIDGKLRALGTSTISQASALLQQGSQNRLAKARIRTHTAILKPARGDHLAIGVARRWMSLKGTVGLS